ncbi:MAG TPA: radical SAM protein [Clostridia bacterium]|nr:radical SAM protein [Clostridia bacterium]
MEIATLIPCCNEELKCNVCPRKCNVNRGVEGISELGFCRMGADPVVARAALHYWEEPCISGVNGSGTVFFSGCNLKCVYCQNYKISHEDFGAKVTVPQLRIIFDNLIDQGANNINLVNPTHFTEAIIQALTISGKLKVPVIYNSSGYDSIESLRKLEGLVDVYLPDLKYIDSNISKKYSSASDYFEVASIAIPEMFRQVGLPKINNQGIIQSGLIVRHLIIPEQAEQSMKVLDWIKENLPEGVMVSLMCQYIPCGEAQMYPEINRRITDDEYHSVMGYLFELNLLDGYIQELESADEEYIPDFNLQGVLN